MCLCAVWVLASNSIYLASVAIQLSLLIYFQGQPTSSCKLVVIMYTETTHIGSTAMATVNHSPLHMPFVELLSISLSGALQMCWNHPIVVKQHGLFGWWLWVLKATHLVIDRLKKAYFYATVSCMSSLLIHINGCSCVVQGNMWCEHDA